MCATQMYSFQFLFLFQLHFRLRKCKSKDNSKSCQDFFKFDMDKICDKLPQKNQIWSEFLDEMDIDRKCPLQPVRNDLHSILPDTYIYNLLVCTYVSTYVCIHVCACICMYYVCMCNLYKHAMP